jgi:uncharacterized protein (DUF983 family)
MASSMDVARAWWQAVWRGVRNLCPACGRGPIFSTMTRMNEVCPHCGVTFQPYEGDFLGAVAIAYTFTAVATLCGFLLVNHFVTWSVTTEVTVWGLFALVFYIVFYPNTKGIWVGLLYLMTGLRKDL